MRRWVFAAMFVLAGAGTALAQDSTSTPPPPQPTPPPGWTRLNPDGSVAATPTPAPTATPEPRTGWAPMDEHESPDAVPSTPGFGSEPGPPPPDVVRPKVHQDPGFDEPVLVPTVGVSISSNSANWNRPQGVAPAPDDDSGASVPLWVGIGMQTMPGRAVPFTAVGMEFNFRSTYGGQNYTEYVPEIRAGMALLRPPAHEYFNRVFPDLEVYGIGGWRIPNRFEAGGARLGVGISSPLLLLLVGETGCDVPLPTMLEATVDYGITVDPQYAVRAGWQF